MAGGLALLWRAIDTDLIPTSQTLLRRASARFASRESDAPAPTGADDWLREGDEEMAAELKARPGGARHRPAAPVAIW
jgi:hypothetical protein